MVHNVKIFITVAKKIGRAEYNKPSTDLIERHTQDNFVVSAKSLQKFYKQVSQDSFAVYIKNS